MKYLMLYHYYYYYYVIEIVQFDMRIIYFIGFR